MALNPLKVFVFVVGGTVAAAATAFYSGAMKSESRLVPDAAQNGSPGGMSVAVRKDAASTDPQTAGGKGDKPAVQASPGAEPSGAVPAVGPPAAETGGQAAPAASGDAAAAPGAALEASLPAAPVSSAPARPSALSDEAGMDTAGAGRGADAGGVPTFDVLRVEPSGETVVAGRAGPGAKVDMVAAGKVLGSADASDEGDFAIVLDEPLSPGEHQIQLAATTPDGNTETSAQTALVSVPEQKNGPVLAMVEEPGVPSRLITVPQASGSPDGPGRDNPPAGASRSPVEEEAPPTAVPQTSGSAETEDSGQAASLSGSASAPQAAAERQVPAEAGASVAAGGTDAAALQASSVQAAASSAPAEPAAADAARAATPAQHSAVSVQAVEIEGRKIYVAGRAAAGSTVRVYADDILLGDAKASAGGQFLIETVRDLPVGTYTVRADVLNGRGTVIARAAVPFEREAGESVAAVAPELQISAEREAAAPSAPASGASMPGGAGDGGPAVRSRGTPAEGTAAAAQASRGSGGAGGQGVSAAARSNGGPVAQQGTEGSAAAPGASASNAEDDDDAASEGEAGAALGYAEPETAARSAGEPGGAGAAERAEAVAMGLLGSAQAGQGAAAGTGFNPAGPVNAATPTQVAAAGAPLASAGDQAVAAAAGAGQAAGSVPTTETAPKLQNVDAAVIIRRGDSLWRISRRVYGLGTRYATIYLANSEQIRNPDLIMPGQVFAVPARSQQGESADLGAIEGQMTTRLPADAQE